MTYVSSASSCAFQPSRFGQHLALVFALTPHNLQVAPGAVAFTHDMNVGARPHTCKWICQENNFAFQSFGLVQVHQSDHILPPWLQCRWVSLACTQPGFKFLDGLSEGRTRLAGLTQTVQREDQFPRLAPPADSADALASRPVFSSPSTAVPTGSLRVQRYISCMLRRASTRDPLEFGSIGALSNNCPP